MERVVTSNEEAIEAWDGVLFDRFVEFRDVLTTGLGVQGAAAMELVQPRPGDRVLDIGCGFGDASQQLAALVGPGGSVHGVDASARFVETARREAADAGVGNVTFEVADVEATGFPSEYDLAFSRMGTMFFANPVAALRHVHGALVPGGRLCMVVWRQKAENDWMYRAEQAVERYVEEDEDSDELTCGPGPFSMANADTTSGILKAAGFEQISLRRSDLPYRIGADLDDAVALALAIGPAGEVMRLAGDDAVRLRPEIEAAVAEQLAPLERPEGVMATSSTWIVTASKPVGV
ncbi:MAG TPA: methyltransferase domain-containing protein [Thermoleophilaceae bacterium]|nr:methyltransferase domain-containing protein [Thermoleophilaceae bacterium]